MNVLPFWSTREKSGAVSPTARLSAVDCLVMVEEGAKAVAPQANEAINPVVNFIVYL